MTRNWGLSKASAPVVAFVDADNLIGETWLFKARSFLSARREEVIIHPEYVLSFEAEDCIWRQISSEHPRFRAGDFIENNYWDATCVANTELLRRFPYQSTMATRGYGYEDWHFNCETLAAGVPHLVVPDTVLFLRKKRSGSLLAQTHQHRRVIRPSDLFRPNVFRRFISSSLPAAE